MMKMDDDELTTSLSFEQLDSDQMLHFSVSNLGYTVCLNTSSK